MVPFIKHSWKGREVIVTLMVKDYPKEGSTLKELMPTIEHIRTLAESMVIQADLKGASLVDVNRFKSIVKLVSEVIEYTKDDDLLQRVEFIGSGVMFRLLYEPISLFIPKYFRDMVVFL
jgi:hypothetical protein